MKSILKYKNFFAYSQKQNKTYFTNFTDGINVIYGRNTSGKSTLIQAILYTFGINDVKIQLSEIIEENPIFRLECKLIQNTQKIKLILIRDDENIYIKKDDEAIKTFFGIGSNNSAEHNKLKEYLHSLFGFNLQLQYKDSLVKAPIETMFLPYYISQSTGWVYLRKSFSGLEFYKNFKNDYLDYYLGIDNNINKLEKQRLQKEKESHINEIKFYNDFIVKKDELVLTKIIDEDFIKTSHNYIEEFQKKQNELIVKEKEFIEECNKLSFYTSRLSVLKKIKRNLEQQNPEKDVCPVCHKELKFSVEVVYGYQQDLNDTLKELHHMKEKQKSTQAEINSLSKKIKELKDHIAIEYKIIQKYKQQNITFESWLENKSNIRLIENTQVKIANLTSSLELISSNLKQYKTAQEIDEIRNYYDKKFAKQLKLYLEELEVNNKFMNIENKYITLYQSSIFPSQGVELHKIVLAHNFAFSQIINDTPKIHRLPFLLDAIFKEDIDSGSKKNILDFIYNNKPEDLQLIVSIAYKENEEESIIIKYNNENFNGEANLISIGDGNRTRAFFENHHNEYKDLLDQTLKIIEG